MRYFPPTLVSPFYHSLYNHPFLDLLEQMHLPRWIFPDFHGKGPQQWMSDPIVIGYIGRWTEDGSYPLLAWIRPAMVWGIFLFAMYGALLCIVAIVRRQWFENERLAFPLAANSSGADRATGTGSFFEQRAAAAIVLGRFWRGIYAA